jgi:Domain of Unknown Function (DUF1080)
MTPSAKRVILVAAGAVLLLFAPAAFGDRFIPPLVWPEPPVITPGEGTAPPSDAIVLFDGKNFNAWNGVKKTTIDSDGGFTVKENFQTKQSFGDVQLHVEFAEPNPPKGRDQGRGNNGIGLMGARYEIQVLDSYENKTYFEGQCASVYNQKPPMVNANRKPGEWQTYDIIFTAPQFDDAGKVTKPAYVTVLHNGVVVQNHTEILGNTHYDKPPSYVKHGKAPLVLMYHGDAVRFRNIWVREFKELEPKEREKKEK